MSKVIYQITTSDNNIITVNLGHVYSVYVDGEFYATCESISEVRDEINDIFEQILQERDD